MDPRLKAKGREVAALRIGLSVARENLLRSGDLKGAKDARDALRRADRLGKDPSIPS